MGRDTARDHGWLLLAATASVLIVIALVAAQLTFTSGTTGRTDTAAFLDEAGGTQGRFVVSVALFTSLAFLVVPVFLGLRRVLADDREIAMDLALGFAILGAAFSGVADATQLALGAGTVPLWHGADAEFRTALLADAQSQLWFGDVLTDLSRLAFGLAVAAASARMLSSPQRLWRVAGGVGLVAATGSVIGSLALAVEALEIVWVVGLAALLLWFLTSAAGLWQASRTEPMTRQRAGAPHEL
jgi:hypothetical protein